MYTNGIRAAATNGVHSHGESAGAGARPKKAMTATFGCYMEDGKRRVDIVMVYEDEHLKKENPDREFDEHESRRRFFQNNLKKDGLELEVDHFQESEKNFMVVKVHCPWMTLCTNAEELHIKTPLKVKDTPLKKKKGNGKKFWDKIVAKVTNANVWGHKTGAILDTTTTSDGEDKNVINWPFKKKHLDRYAINDRDTFFVQRQRIEVVWEILQQAQNDPDDPKKRGIESLLEHKIYETVFPLHDGDLHFTKSTPAPQWTSRQKLKATWASWSTLFQMQPLWDVRSYFGEKIGFYFAFMDSYTRWLTIPSLFGLIAFFFGLYYASDHPELHNVCDSIHGEGGHGEVTHGEGGHGEVTHGEGSHTVDAHGMVTHATNIHGVERRIRDVHAAHTTESSHGESIAEHGVTPHNLSHAADEYKVANLWMCPICEPPDCDIWEMYEEGCFQYTWSFRLDNEASIILSCVVILWSIIFLKCWRRRESKLAVDWDTHDAEEHNMIIRPNYEERAPTQHKNPITLESEPYVPMTKRCTWIFASVMATFFLLIFATLCLLALVMSRIALYGQFKKVGGIFAHKNVEFARWSVHGLIFIMVTVFEELYHWIAHKLTEYECPKTDNQFISSLLWKIFIFEMMNDFVPIAYAAWVKGKVSTPINLNFLSELCDGGCIGEVTELVAVLLLARLVIGNTMEVGVPFLKHAFKEYVQSKEKGDAESKRKPQWQNDFYMEDVELDGVYDEYMEMMIQFSFIVFFSSALPVAPFLCFLNNVVEIRVDAINMLTAHRRPVPIRVPGIQIWNSFLDIIIKLGIIINAGLIAFTSDNIPKFYYKYINSTGHGYIGFIRFSLSRVPISGWDEKHHSDLMNEQKDGYCYYPDWRSDVKPFAVDQDYYQILTLRVAAFSIFCMIFFIIMWFLNTFISDVPADAKTKVQRRLYVVTRTLEAENVAGQSKFLAHRTKALASRKHEDVIETNFH